MKLGILIARRSRTVTTKIMYKKHDARAELLFWLLGHVHSSPDIFETTDFRNESAFTRNQ